MRRKSGNVIYVFQLVTFFVLILDGNSKEWRKTDLFGKLTSNLRLLSIETNAFHKYHGTTFHHYFYSIRYLKSRSTKKGMSRVCADLGTNGNNKCARVEGNWSMLIWSVCWDRQKSQIRNNFQKRPVLLQPRVMGSEKPSNISAIV